MSDGTDRPTLAPFLGALSIFALVVIAIVVVNAFGSDEATVDQQLRGAVVGQNDALQRRNYADFSRYTCRAAQGDEANVLLLQRESVDKDGARFVDEVTDLHADGDQATARVTYHFAKRPEATSTSEVTLTREDGAWRVCTAPGVRK